MPMLADLNQRFSSRPVEEVTSGSMDQSMTSGMCDEILVADDRASLSPRQHVEQKLQGALNCPFSIALSATGPRRKKAE